MSTNIVNSILINNDGKESVDKTSKSVERQLKTESSLKKFNISTENTRPYKVNIFEKKDDWIIGKKDSERTIIEDNYHVLKTNKESSSSLSFSEKVNESDSFIGEIHDSISLEKPGHLSHSKTLVNDDIFETVSIEKHVPITHSETLVNEDTIRTTTTEKSDPVTVTHSETLINEENYRNFLTEHADHSIDSLESLYDFSPVVDEIISDNGILTDSLERFEVDQKENYSFENNNLQIDNFDGSLITFSDESLSYDDIFNYNSNIILSDDEDARREKIEELYNEAVIMNNLDDNTFAFINEDSYNEYFDNSIDNSGSTDYSLFERDPNICHRRSSLSKSLDLSFHNSQGLTNMKSINQEVNLFSDLPLDTIYPDNIEESSKYKVVSPMNDDKFVSADDDAIYVIDDGYVDSDDDSQEQKNKKKVTFNENVKVERIDRVDVRGDVTFKSFIKNRFKKLKQLFTGDNKKNDDNDNGDYDFEDELPIVTIEYVDDYYDCYNKKEVLFFGEDYPRIVIDFADDYYDMDEYDESYYDNPYIYDESFEEEGPQLNEDDNQEMKNNHLDDSIGENVEHVKLMNDDSEAVKYVNEINEPHNQEDEEIPFYLREVTPQKNKEKQKIAKKLIDKVINMEKSFRLEQEKKLSNQSNKAKEELITELPKESELSKESESPKESESLKESENSDLSISDQEVQINSTDIQETIHETMSPPKNKPILKKIKINELYKKCL
ncbi:hypothetical protein PIROE2DRAFT_60546 [Piromyces sp. E2]|nr:hypothetical protein PIROE2DRAFT_60546 [Piromyces sp. E2]|eukprot:OUM64586.1 hypothetical protein PIROE2DRAFT_60546 [Piromyces sp. E2]